MRKSAFFYHFLGIANISLFIYTDTISRLQRIDSEVEGDQQHHHDYSYETSIKAKKFYAQRNLYLTGFTLFLSL
jgi:B-cell receptor-associated protein 31